VTHENKLDNKATIKAYSELDNRVTIKAYSKLNNRAMTKAYSKLAAKHLQRSIPHPNFSKLLLIQLSLSLVKTMNFVSNASLSISSALNVNDYRFSLFNINMISNALPGTSLINFINLSKTPRSTQTTSRAACEKN